jgi:hypothetical protein
MKQFTRIFLIAIASSAFVTMAAAQIQVLPSPAFQFDLSCSGKDVVSGRTASPVRFHIDLAKQEWCMEGGECPHSLIVEKDKLFLRIDAVRDSYGLTDFDWWVDRGNGALHMDTDIFGGMKYHVEGECQVEPYNTPSKKIF